MFARDVNDPMASILALLAGLSLLLGACVQSPQPTSVATEAVVATAVPPTMAPSATIAPPTMAPTATQIPPTAVPTAAVAATLTPESAAPESALEGQWEGPIEVANQKIDIVVRFRGSGSDLQGWIDIPAQGVRDYQLSKPSFVAPKVSFEAFPAPRVARFDGMLQTDGSISGKFIQAGYEGTFSLTRAVAKVEPTEVVPYRQEEVTFTNGDVKLAGTLSLPQGSGPFPAVVLISGSGQQNRDEEVMGFRPFRLIADYLTRSGIAVLRYDDRGIGGSTGDVASATSEDFAKDVLAAVGLLKTRPEINPKQIGLLGHSEGGIIAPMVAANAPQDIAFVIMLAGPGVDGGAILEQQVGDVLKATGATQAAIDEAVAEEKRMLQVVRFGEGLDAYKASLLEKARVQLAVMTDEQKKALGDLEQAARDMVNAQILQIESPWFKFFITYDPAPTLAKVQVPVLALFGGKDVQVAAGPNAQAVKDALAKGTNKRVSIKTYPNANHLFQPATTGAIAEYSQLKEFVPDLLSDITRWIEATLQ